VLYSIQIVALFIQYPWLIKNKEPSEDEDGKVGFYFRHSYISYQWSHQLVQAALPILVIFIRFDESGYGTAFISCSIFSFTAIKHLLIDDFAYKVRLLKRRSIRNKCVKVENVTNLPASSVEKEVVTSPKRTKATNRYRKPWLNNPTAISEEES